MAGYRMCHRGPRRRRGPTCRLARRAIGRRIPNLHGSPNPDGAITKPARNSFRAGLITPYIVDRDRKQSTPRAAGENRRPCSTTSTTAASWNWRETSPGSAGWPQPDATATAHSKLCGSTVTVDLKMDGDTVTDFAHEVKACALGQASSSIMASHVVGSKADELRKLRDTVRKMLKENGAPPDGRQVGRHRGARTGARLQGAPRLDHADLRRGGRRHRPDREASAEAAS